ncbi:hypothetical protein ANN_00948 [Periplaneta americana]|uniref:Uncharacterized protein n=1 Tax=Periplaneta americana TaxID=6978 RepID=A0ABQ8TS85_PERAM|nr:hypothetical protein ANN_00948 [Periplaneta americana]
MMIIHGTIVECLCGKLEYLAKIYLQTTSLSTTNSNCLRRDSDPRLGLRAWKAEALAQWSPNQSTVSSSSLARSSSRQRKVVTGQCFCQCFCEGTLRSTLSPDPELRLGVDSIPGWADYLVVFVPKVKRMSAERTDDLLARIVIEDGTWLHHFGPETEADNGVASCKFTKEIEIQKYTFGRKRYGYCVFDSEGLLLVDIMPHGTTINSDGYVATLKKLQVRLSRVRRHREKQDVMLLHDNTQPYVSHKTTDQIRKFG